MTVQTKCRWRGLWPGSLVSGGIGEPYGCTSALAGSPSSLVSSSTPMRSEMFIVPLGGWIRCGSSQLVPASRQKSCQPACCTTLSPAGMRQGLYSPADSICGATDSVTWQRTDVQHQVEGCKAKNGRRLEECRPKRSNGRTGLIAHLSIEGRKGAARSTCFCSGRLPTTCEGISNGRTQAGRQV